MPPDALQARDDVRMVLKGLRGAAAAFLPAIVILLCGVAGMWRGYFPRKLGYVALVCGVLSIVAYLGVVYGIDYGENEEPMLKRVNLTVELGAYLLIVAGIGGMIGGALGIWKPEGAPPPKAPFRPHVPPPAV